MKLLEKQAGIKLYGLWLGYIESDSLPNVNKFDIYYSIRCKEAGFATIEKMIYEVSYQI